MRDGDKTKEQLLAELADLRRRVADLEQADTERQRAQEDLRQSEQRLSLHFHQTPLAAIEWDLDFRVTRWNPGAENIFGYSQEEAIGRHSSFIVPPEVRENIDDIWNALVARRGGERSTNKNTTKGGGVLLCEWYNTPLVNADGRVIGVASLVDDITERKQAEKALQQQSRELAAINRLGQLVNAHLSLEHFGEAAIRGIIDALDCDIVILFRRDGERLLLQIRGSNEFTHPHNDLPMHRVGECLCGLAVSEGRAVYSSNIDGDTRCTWEECKQVGVRSFAALPLRIGEEIIGVLGLGSAAERDFQKQSSFLETIANDIAMGFHNSLLYERLQTHADQLERRVEDRTAELRAANERLQKETEERRQTQAILDAFFTESPAILNIVDEDFVYIKTDSLTPTYFGLDSQSIVGRSLKDELAPQFVEAFGPMMRKVMEDGQPAHNVEVKYLLPTEPEETVYWRASYFPLSLTEGKRGFGVVAVEISDMKRVQEALKRERQTLMHMLQASDHERQLIAYEIHDGLAQQLAAAIMQFQVYDTIKESDPVQGKTAYDAGTQMLQRAHSETRRLISGVRPPILDESGIAAAIAHLVHSHAGAAAPKVNFHSDVKVGRLAKVLENAIYRIAQESLANALQHSGSERIAVSFIQENGSLRLEVQDWGVGFDPESVAENRFGLEGIRERIKLLGGELSIQSEPGKGTRILAVLPIMEEE